MKIENKKLKKKKKKKKKNKIFPSFFKFLSFLFFPPNFSLVSNLTQEPPLIILSNSVSISSSSYPEL